MLAIRLIFLTLWWTITSALWFQPPTFLSGLAQLIQQQKHSSWSNPVRITVEASPNTEQPTVEVKQLVTATYQGVNFVMVKNVSLGFAQAEQYCSHEFSEPMHLASIQSEEEWKMLTNVFGTPDANEIWLGGSVLRSSQRIFVLRWLGDSAFAYHRFPINERKRWRSNWRVNSQGCIVANKQSNGRGNWTAELTPCTKPRGFICKETNTPRETMDDDLLSPYNSMSLLDTLRNNLMSHNRFSKPPFQWQRHTNAPATEFGAKPSFSSPTTPQTVDAQSTTQPTVTTPASITDVSKHEETKPTPLPVQTSTAPEPTTQATTTITTTTQAPETTTTTTLKPTILRGSDGSLTSISVAKPIPLPQSHREAIQRVEDAGVRPRFRIFPIRSLRKGPPNNVAAPGVAAQVIHPHSIWDLTYPEEPSWMINE